VADARHDQRVRVGDVDQGEPAAPGPCGRVFGQQRRLGVFFIEVFEDRQRLEQLRIAVDQRRHHHLRVDRLVGWVELVALFEMQVGILVAEPF
jgi:hypothetical protein